MPLELRHCSSDSAGFCHELCDAFFTQAASQESRLDWNGCFARDWLSNTPVFIADYRDECPTVIDQSAVYFDGRAV